jgi:protein SCO1/2
MKPTALILIIAALAVHAVGAELSDAALRQITFEQKPGAQISPGLQFRDENGRAVKIGDYLGGKPVILVPGYYGCPMLCTLVLNGLVESMQDLKANVGSDFAVLNYSIDPSEKPPLAAQKKATYLRRYGRDGAAAGWHFLTGDEASIKKLSDQIGFRYAYDPAIKQYAHPSGFVVITPQGKVVRYFFGVDFAAKDLDVALRQAADNQTGSPVRQLLLLCFHYSPITGKYGNLILASVRICGIATLAALCLLIGRGILRSRVSKT